MVFYGLVGPRDSILKPFIKSENLEYLKEIRGDRYDIAIIKYKGYKRLSHRREELVIQDSIK